MRGAALALLLTIAPPARAMPQTPVIPNGAPPTALIARGLYLYAEGDYPGAADMLKIVAFARPDLSAAADVALADMYERGLGVPQDVVHAYALYLHAGTGAEGPNEVQLLGRAALRRLERSLTEGEIREAMRMATGGFREGLVSQFLPLRTGGILELSRDHIAVTHDGSTSVEEWGEYGMWFEHARLLDPGAIPQRARDLLDVLFWRTTGEFERTLVWRVYAIERGAIGVACEASLLVMRGFTMQSPHLPADLRERARLVSRDTGELTCEPGPLVHDGISQ